MMLNYQQLCRGQRREHKEDFQPFDHNNADDDKFEDVYNDEDVKNNTVLELGRVSKHFSTLMCLVGDMRIEPSNHMERYVDEDKALTS